MISIKKKNEKILLLCVIFLFSIFFGSLQGQSIKFVERTGEENPLANVTTVSSLISSPVDIDNDGDFDFLLGDNTGRIRFYKNTGTEENPNLFEEQLDERNPLSSVDLITNILPIFVDIDGDNDLDVFIGGNNKISYYKNIGNVSNPIFIKQEENNPLFSVSSETNIDFFTVFVDIDFDNDLDVFIGWVDSHIESGRGILFYKNIGSKLSPSFENQIGNKNPFQTFDKLYPIPTFVDVDGDLDLDVFIETGNGKYLFYENTTDINLKTEDVVGNSVLMYPNPAKNEVTITISDEATKVRVVTMSGIEAYRDVLTNEKRTMNISSLEPGIYLVLIESGSLKTTKKLIVTK